MLSMEWIIFYQFLCIIGILFRKRSIGNVIMIFKKHSQHFSGVSIYSSFTFLYFVQNKHWMCTIVDKNNSNHSIRMCHVLRDEWPQVVCSRWVCVPNCASGFVRWGLHVLWYSAGEQANVARIRSMLATLSHPRTFVCATGTLCEYVRAERVSCQKHLRSSDRAIRNIVRYALRARNPPTISRLRWHRATRIHSLVFVLARTENHVLQDFTEQINIVGVRS